MPLDPLVPTLEPPWQLALGGLLMMALMTVLWAYQVWRRDAGIVDVGWSAGLGVMAVFVALTGSGDPHRRLLLAAISGTWSARLAGYLLVNRVWGRSEDGRYQTLRRRWGPRANRNFFWFFQFQAALVLVFALPMIVVAQDGRPLALPTAALALALGLLSIGGESLADRQLARHRARRENRSVTCRAGLWRYSRHPNYFFEWLHWWVYVLLAAGGSGWWLTLAGPALMLLFLFRVTGIPATERQAVVSRGDDYRRYQQTTSAFIPWFPRHSDGGSGPAQG